MTDSEDRKRGDRFEFVNENRKIDKNIRKHRGQKPDIGTTMYVKHRRHRLIDKNRGIHMQIRSTRAISFDFRIEKNISPTFDLQTEKNVHTSITTMYRVNLCNYRVKIGVFKCERRSELCHVSSRERTAFLFIQTDTI